jgi:hypothetical protein
MKSKLLPSIAFVLLSTLSVVICPKLKAQEPTSEEKHSLLIGVEGGWMRNQQSGSFKSGCGCKPFEDGKGNSGMAAAFIEFKTNKYITFGAKLGLDLKSISSSHYNEDSLYLVDKNSDQVVFAKMNYPLSVDVHLTYLYFSPFISFTPFGTGFFLLAAPEFGNLISSHIIATRQLPNPVVLSNGDTIKNALFQNGKTSEKLDDGPIQDVNKLRIAILFSAGYDFRILNNLSIVPEATYNLPLTTISSGTRSSNWKISSYAFELGIKYRID